MTGAADAAAREDNVFALERAGVVLGGKAILSDVNMSISSGTRTAIVGRSGSGKSTLLRLLSFLLRPTSGTVSFLGSPADPSEITQIRRRLPLVHQEPILWPETVLDNLIRPYSYASAAGAEHPGEERLAGLLEAAGLDCGMLRSRIEKLSGGEKQRVAVARALALRPEALLLDEPTSALDLLTAEKLFDSLTDSFPELTVVLVTHSPSLVERCDHQVLLEDGRVRAVRSGVRADELRRFLESGE